MSTTPIRYSDLTKLQKELCEKYSSGFHLAELDDIIGVSKSILENSARPINGLRHSTTEQTSGWYIWAGEWSDDADFFQPIHLSHLIEKNSQIIPYLGLPPGWRFLIDPEQNYEDVWQDQGLILDK